MGIFNTLHQKKVNNGIFIALLVVFAAGIVAWWYYKPITNSAGTRSEIHPLSNTDKVQLCNLLPPVKNVAACHDSDQQTAIAGHSMWVDSNEKLLLRADLVTTRNLMSTEKVSTLMWFQHALPEIRASGRLDWNEPSGNWAHAVITRRDAEQEILLEDDGIVLILQSSALSRSDLLAYANQAAIALRAANATTSSADAATP